jgi:hypothetical protein
LLRIFATARWLLVVAAGLSCLGILFAEGHVTADWTSIRENLPAVIMLGLLVAFPLARIAWIWRR